MIFYYHIHLSSYGAIINFEDITGTVVDGYKGLNWSNGDEGWGAGYSYSVGAQTLRDQLGGSSTADNRHGGNPERIDAMGNATFDFTSLWITASGGTMDITFTGWIDGSLVKTMANVEVNQNEAKKIVFDWENIDAVEITYAGASNKWQIDNIDITTSPVPEPATMLLFGLGLLGLAGVNRRKQ